MSLSSIFSFKTLQRWQTFPAGLFTCLLVLAGIELFVARSDWIIERFPSSSLGAVYALESQLIQGTEPEIVCLGNSRLRDGLAPRVLEEELGMRKGSVLNLALTAGTPFDSHVLYRRNRTVLRQAKMMIVDVEYDYYIDAPVLSPRIVQFATFHEHVRLFQTRKQLVLALVGGIWRTFGLRDYLRALIIDPDNSNSLVLADDGRIVWRDRELDNRIDVQADIIEQGKVFETIRLDHGHERELRRLIALAREDNVKVVLLHVPMRDEYVRHLKETFPENYRRARVEFQESVFDVDLLLDWEQGGEIGLLDDDYFDYGHMTNAGSEKMTRAVADQLGRRGRLEAGKRSK